MPVKYEIEIKERPDGLVVVNQNCPPGMVTPGELKYAKELSALLKQWQESLHKRGAINMGEN